VWHIRAVSTCAEGSEKPGWFCIVIRGVARNLLYEGNKRGGMWTKVPPAGSRGIAPVVWGRSPRQNANFELRRGTCTHVPPWLRDWSWWNSQGLTWKINRWTREKAQKDCACSPMANSTSELVELSWSDFVLTLTASRYIETVWHCSCMYGAAELR